MAQSRCRPASRPPGGPPGGRSSSAALPGRRRAADDLPQPGRPGAAGGDRPPPGPSRSQDGRRGHRRRRERAGASPALSLEIGGFRTWAGDVQQSVCCTPAVQAAVYPAVQYSPVGDGCETKNTLDPRFSFLYCTADPETGSPAGPSVPVVSCTPGSVLLHTSSSISPDIAPPSEMSPFRPLPTCSAGCTAGVQQGQLLYTVAVRDTVSTSLRRGRTACEDVHAARRQHRRGGGRDRRRTAQGARRRPAKKEGGGLRGS
jgi:hypothetical protein